ncbi:MAG: four helix bundle protein [Nitrospiraceae bacterium]|nr:four helix bundle protein [Nitrospiraceae bacterium]
MSPAVLTGTGSTPTIQSGEQGAVNGKQNVQKDSGSAGTGKPHVRLEAWKASMDLAETVYRMTAHFPGSEQFGLISQMRRAAISVPCNIAEGAARDSRKEFSQFLSIAKGSLSELDTQYMLAVRVGCMRRDLDFEELLARTSKLLTGLHKKIKGAPSS